jgi:transcriptional regulator with XRE-family HTH domain
MVQVSTTITTPTAQPGQAQPGQDRASHAQTPQAQARQVRRRELAAFLRSRRDRITPEDVGLPPGTRRRTAGLRREEVAQLAGVGVTWYTWLEQGRPINASVQVLDAVARTLKLDPAEREHLYRLADIPDASATAGAAPEHPVITPDIQRILDNLTPLPASVMNERFDILAWNAAYAAVWPGVLDAAPGRCNTLWTHFTFPDCCQTYLNRHEQAGTMVAQLRAAYGRHLGEPAWTSFVQKLQAHSPLFAQLWAEQHVASQVSYLKVFRHPAYPRLTMTTTSLAVLAIPGTRIVVYNPADDTCREAIDSLLAGHGQDEHFPCWPTHRRTAGGPEQEEPAPRQ